MSGSMILGIIVAIVIAIVIFTKLANDYSKNTQLIEIARKKREKLTQDVAKFKKYKIALTKLAEEKTQGFPWLAKVWDEYLEFHDLETEDYLIKKRHPAPTAAEVHKQIAKERREALKAALRRHHTSLLEEQHRRGYKLHPVSMDEFDVWEDEQAWGEE